MRAFALFASTILLFAACQSRSIRVKSSSLPSVQPKVATPAFTVGTFNAGLAIGMIHASAERARPAIDALSAEHLDALCVQEFWLEEHFQALQQKLAPRLPHVVHPAPRGVSTDKACLLSELSPVASCALKHCWSAGSDRAAECAMHHCGALARNLDAHCVSCLSRNPLRSISAILDECVDESPTAKPRPRPRDAKLEFFGGAYGIGLFSAQPFLATDTLDLPSNHHPRAVLYAKIAALDTQLNVFCTHLSPILDKVPRPDGGSWEDEQRQQLSALMRWVDTKSHGEPVLVLGDLNFGPGEPPRVKAREREHFALLEEAGFESPYVNHANAKCTFCYDNPLTRGDHDKGLIIDHVLLRGLRYTATPSRMLDTLVPLDVGAGTEQLPLSDHYGVKVELRPLP